MSSPVIVYKWRIYCNTENDWVYIWSENVLTTCPNNTSHDALLNSVQITDQIQSNDVNITNISQSPFLDNIMVQKISLIDLKSFYPLSILRDNTAGDVSHQQSEIQISTTTNSSSVSHLISADRGTYVAGTICETGIAIRIPEELVGNQTLKFGYFDDNNGFYFKIGASGSLSCCIMDGGTVTEITRNNFNMYKLDGTESVGINLDMTKGNIFQIRFSWYGYGAVQFGVISNGPDNIQKVFPFHRYFTQGHTSTKNPNLPIKVLIENNGETTSSSVFVAGRQYSMFGSLPDLKRENMYYVMNDSITSSFLPVFSLLKKTEFINCKVIIKKIIIKANVDAVVRIVQGNTLSGSSFVSNTEATESALQIDTSSSSFAGGVIVFNEHVFENETKTIDVNIDVYHHTTSIVAKRLETSLDGETVSIAVKYQENW